MLAKGRIEFPPLRACPSCDYTLVGDSGKSTCPECGLEISPKECFIRLPRPKGTDGRLPGVIRLVVVILVWLAVETYTGGLRAAVGTFATCVLVLALGRYMKLTHPVRGVVAVTARGVEHYSECGRASVIGWERVRGISLHGRAGRRHILVIKLRGASVPRTYVCGANECDAGELLSRARKYWKQRGRSTSPDA